MFALAQKAARPFQLPLHLALRPDGQGDFFQQGLRAHGLDNAVVHAAFVQQNKALFIDFVGDNDAPQLRKAVFELAQHIGHVPISEVLLNEQQGLFLGGDQLAHGVQQHIGIAADGQAARGHFQACVDDLAQHVSKGVVVGNADDLAVITQIFNDDLAIGFVLLFAFGHGFFHGLLDLPDLDTLHKAAFCTVIHLEPPFRQNTKT